MKQFNQLWSPIPNKFILDGTANKLSKNDWLIYHILAMHQNYNTHTAHVSFNLFKKYKNLSGKSIQHSLTNLQNLLLIKINQSELINPHHTSKRQTYTLLGF